MQSFALLMAHSWQRATTHRSGRAQGPYIEHRSRDEANVKVYNAGRLRGLQARHVLHCAGGCSNPKT